jgi:hypothetical protein
LTLDPSTFGRSQQRMCTIKRKRGFALLPRLLFVLSKLEQMS